MNFDMKMVAQFQFASKFHLEMSEELKKYQNQTSVANTKVDSQKSSMIGGEPPVSGSWIDWQKTVRDNLAPISYELTTLSALFGFIPNLNASQATAGFLAYLENYCKTEKCPPI